MTTDIEVGKKLTWAQRIERAKLVDEFTYEDTLAALDWITCAVGEHRGEYQEMGDDEDVDHLPEAAPADSELAKLGTRFYQLVEHNNVEGAFKTYQEIQLWFEEHS